MTLPLAAPTAPNPLPQPVLERIVEDLLYTLGEIKPANGYSNTVTAGRPKPGLGNALVDGRVTVFVGAAESQDPPEQWTQWPQHFHLLAEVRESEKSSTTIQERLNGLRAGIEYILTSSEASWQRSLVEGHALAENTILEGALYAVPDPQAHEGEVQIDIAVQYRTALNNPFVCPYGPPPAPPDPPP